MLPDRPAPSGSSIPRRIAEHIGGYAGREVRELGVAGQGAFELEAALLEHPRRRAVPGMAERVQPLDAGLGGQIAHRRERLRRVAEAPGVVSEYISRGRLRRRLEAKAGAAEEHAVVPGLDEE